MDTKEKKKKKTFHETKLNEHFHVLSFYFLSLLRDRTEGWKWEGNPMEKDGMPPVISMERKLMLIGFATRNSFHSSARSVELQLDRAGIKVELNFET